MPKLAANLSMLLGVFIAQRIHAIRPDPEPKRRAYKSEGTLIAIATTLAIVLRVGIMTIVNYTTLRYPFPIGYSTPEPLIIAWLPLIGIFNATLALYTIPLGYAITDVVKRNIGAQVKIKT